MDTETTADLVSKAYARMDEMSSAYRRTVGRPLTLAEKILAGHLSEPPGGDLDSGRNYVFLRPDRVALQDVTGQMVMLQFMLAGLGQAALPTTVHCDHLIRARVDGPADMKVSLDENSEVFRFLRSAASRYGVGFWKPGAGIIHQVVLENYAFPGGADDRDRLAHPQRGRAWHAGSRRRRRGRGRDHGRHAPGRSCTPGGSGSG